jgi:hypothetical protein
MATSTSNLTGAPGVPDGLAGTVLLPTDDHWDDARRAWHREVDQRPAAIALAESAHDVAAAVLLARTRGLRVAPQSTGHNAAPLGSLHDTLLLKTERMRGVTIDPRTRIARVAAGVLAIELVEAAARYGLTPVAGTSPDVGVVGYTIGGGLSLLGRRYGLAANHVHAIELVTADGRLVRADRDHEPDLFWALRGGGGSFGVVTAIELELIELTEAYAGLLWYPVQRAGEVLHAWRELTAAGPPDALTTVGRLLNFPPLPEVPEPVRGKSFVVVEACHAGDRADADELLAPLRALAPVNDTIRAVTMPELNYVHMDPEGPVSGVGDGLMLAELPPEALDTVVELGNTFGLAAMELRHLEGELGRARPGHGALASVPGRYVLVAGGYAPTRELMLAVQRQVEAVKETLAPWATRSMYLNFAATSRDPASFWPTTTYERLRRVKAAVDPGDVIRSNHPVPPLV